MKNHYLDQRIRLKKGNLSETEQKIAHYFVHSDEMLSRKTLEDMANDIEVSQSSIYQFVKKIGYNGFQDFKIDIARNSNYQPAFQNLNINTGADDILPEDSSIDIAKKLFSLISTH